MRERKVTLSSGGRPATSWRLSLCELGRDHMSFVPLACVGHHVMESHIFLICLVRILIMLAPLPRLVCRRNGHLLSVAPRVGSPKPRKQDPEVGSRAVFDGLISACRGYLALSSRMPTFQGFVPHLIATKRSCSLSLSLSLHFLSHPTAHKSQSLWARVYPCSRHPWLHRKPAEISDFEEVPDSAEESLSDGSVASFATGRKSKAASKSARAKKSKQSRGSTTASTPKDKKDQQKRGSTATLTPDKQCFVSRCMDKKKANKRYCAKHNKDVETMMYQAQKKT